MRSCDERLKKSVRARAVGGENVCGKYFLLMPIYNQRLEQRQLEIVIVFFCAEN